MRIAPGEARAILAAPELFDDPPTEEWTARFLQAPGHHILMALEGDDAVGFVTGIELSHPDKGTEMLLYELSVLEEHRRRGIATELVNALKALAEERGCYGMWVGTEHDNVAALATYRAAGDPERESFVGLTWTFGTDATSS